MRPHGKRFFCVYFLCTHKKRPEGMQILCSFNFAGSQARSTNVHFLSSTVYINLYRFYIGFPHFARSSMGMAHVVSEMSTFFTDRTLCHDCTSLTLFIVIVRNHRFATLDILTEELSFCKQKYKFFKNYISFSTKTGYNTYSIIHQRGNFHPKMSYKVVENGVNSSAIK